MKAGRHTMSYAPIHTTMPTYCLLSLIFAVFAACCSVYGAPVHKGHAEKAVRTWLDLNRKPMEADISRTPGTIETHRDPDGQILYYSVNLEPTGFVALSPNDEIEPVIAFSSTGHYDGQEGNPLKGMLEKDMKGRLEQLRHKGQGNSKGSKGKKKWDTLLAADDDTQPSAAAPIAAASELSVSDVRVAPFVQTKWGQGNVGGSPCYNYYTPNNYLAGCVATGMAQLMRYHSFPTLGIGVNSFPIQVNGVPQYRNTLGGNGVGGPYNWTQMTYDPAVAVTTTQRQAIGALCHDAGVAAEMGYTSSGSSASLYDSDKVFVSTFDYSNSIYGQGFSSSGDGQLWSMVNCNLDAQLPVLLGVSRVTGGHVVIADGYGYNGGTMYHHLNLGWDGSDNAWYQLPTIDTSSYTYTLIKDCVYNVYTSGTGEIVSGRVTSLAGIPMASAQVTARVGASIARQTTTDSRGIYALEHLSSNTEYRISVVKSGQVFADRYITTGTSTDSSATTGNKWAVNIASTNASPPTALNSQVDVVSTQPVDISLMAPDDNEPDPDLITFIITSLPSHGDLSEPDGGPAINRVPYPLPVTKNVVSYTPCPYFGGADSFKFKANDSGTPPTGGESNIATVTVNVDDKLYTDYATGSNTYIQLMMNTGNFYDARSQVIYLQNDIGPARYLTDLALNIYIAPGRTLQNWTIRMQHTNLTYFNDVVNQFLTSGWTTVYQGSVGTSQTGWVNFHFQTPFEYNGTQNLLVDFSFNNSGRTSPGGGHFIDNAGSNRVLTLASQTGEHEDPLDWGFWALGGSYYLGDYVPSAKFIGTVPIDPIAGDFDASCDVDLSDIGIFSSAWKTVSGGPNYNPDCNISDPKGTGIIENDLLILLNNWMKTYP